MYTVTSKALRGAAAVIKRVQVCNILLPTRALGIFSIHTATVKSCSCSDMGIDLQSKAHNFSLLWPSPWLCHLGGDPLRSLKQEAEMFLLPWMAVLSLCDKVFQKDDTKFNSGENLGRARTVSFTWGSLRSSRGKLVGRKTSVLPFSVTNWSLIWITTLEGDGYRENSTGSKMKCYFKLGWLSSLSKISS